MGEIGHRVLVGAPVGVGEHESSEVSVVVAKSEKPVNAAAGDHPAQQRQLNRHRRQSRPNLDHHSPSHPMSSLTRA